MFHLSLRSGYVPVGLKMLACVAGIRTTSSKRKVSEPKKLPMVYMDPQTVVNLAGVIEVGFALAPEGDHKCMGYLGMKTGSSIG